MFILFGVKCVLVSELFSTIILVIVYFVADFELDFWCFLWLNLILDSWGSVFQFVKSFVTLHSFLGANNSLSNLRIA